MKWLTIGFHQVEHLFHELHNIIQIHNNVSWDWQLFHVVFPDIRHIRFECGEYMGISDNTTWNIVSPA